MRRVIYVSLLLISSLLFYLLGYRVGQPMTYHSSSDIDGLIGATNYIGTKWMANDPIRYKIGRYFFMFPKDLEKGVGSIAIFYKGGYPFLLAQDLDGNGMPDELIMKDSSGKSVGVSLGKNDEKSLFQSSFSTISGTPNLDAVTYIDKDFDGQPDIIYSDEEGIISVR